MPHTYKGQRLGTYKRPKNSPTLATIRQSPSPGNKYVVTKKVGRFTILTKLVPVKRGRFTVYYRPS